MSECVKCGKTVKANDTFCTVCGTEQAGAQSGARQDKKARVLGREQTWKKPLIITVAVLSLAGGLWFAKVIVMNAKMGGRPVFAPLRDASVRLAKATIVQNEAGMIKIPLSTVSDGNAHFFAYSAQGSMITFFVMRAGDGSIRTAYDACMACNHAKLGYRQEGSKIVCNNCGMGFDPAEIGAQKGGCNPIPVDRSLDGKMVVLKAKDLEAGAQYF